MIEVTRSPASPDSLASNTAWDGADVKEQLRADFLGKCYLTESPLCLGSFEIDHRRPKAVFPALTYEWTNLFPATADTNNRRPRTWPDGGLLDPTLDRIEIRLEQWLDDDSTPHFAAVDHADVEAANTAAELDHLHNSTNTKAFDLRDAIKSQLLRVFTKCLALRDAAPDSQEAIRLETELRTLLSRRSPFTMLIRSKFRDRLGHLFD